MKSDMAGSAAVIGAMKAIASMKLRANVVGIVAACENMVSGGAYKNGDVIGSMAGKTIEIKSTDAEGRLGGTITGGLFVGEFVQGKPWIHMDIAGTSGSNNDSDYTSKGAAGVGTLYELVKSM